MRGVVACETLYKEIERLAPDAEVRYLPHDLHEFPLNVADDREIRTYMEAAITDLESVGVSSITVAFAGRDGLAGVRTRSVPLVVSLADECVSTFRYEEFDDETGEVKEPGVYYLTRGTIDRAVDAYKLYSAYRGRSEELHERFERAQTHHPDLRVDWQESRLYEHALERGRGMTASAVDRFFASMLGYYHTVELLDTGSLYDLHHWYAARVRDFLGELEDQEGTEVELRVTDGDLGLLETLFEDDPPAESEYVAVFEPGEPVPE